MVGIPLDGRLYAVCEIIAVWPEGAMTCLVFPILVSPQSMQPAPSIDPGQAIALVTVTSEAATAGNWPRLSLRAGGPGVHG